MTSRDGAESVTNVTALKGEEAEREYTRPWMPSWLAAFKRERSVTNACAAVHISRVHAYRCRKADIAFSEAWTEIEEIVRDDLEASAMKRAIDGWDEPVFYKGEMCGTVRKFSNALTIFMLKCHRPERFNIAPQDPGGEGTVDSLARLIRTLIKSTETGGEIEADPEAPQAAVEE